jgi:hypothetical protein
MHWFFSAKWKLGSPPGCFLHPQSLDGALGESLKPLILPLPMLAPVSGDLASVLAPLYRPLAMLGHVGHLQVSYGDIAWPAEKMNIARL